MKAYIFVVKFQYIVKYTLHGKYYSLRKTVITKFRLKNTVMLTTLSDL